MTRQAFIKLCGSSCLAVVGMSLFAEHAAAIIRGVQVEEGMRVTIPKEDFIKKQKGDKTVYRKYIVVHDERLEFPVIVYRFDEEEEEQYAALLMRCSHQGNELSANGDILSCGAHGSEFTSRGVVLQGPAEAPLTTYETTTDETNVYVKLS